MSGLDIFLGDPIYDDQNRVVRREFGVKNVVAIAITLYVGNVLMGQMKPKSGQRKMKGGIQSASKEGVRLTFGVVYAISAFVGAGFLVDNVYSWASAGAHAGPAGDFAMGAAATIISLILYVSLALGLWKWGWGNH